MTTEKGGYHPDYEKAPRESTQTEGGVKHRHIHSKYNINKKRNQEEDVTFIIGAHNVADQVVLQTSKMLGNVCTVKNLQTQTKSGKDGDSEQGFQVVPSIDSDNSRFDEYDKKLHEEEQTEKLTKMSLKFERRELLAAMRYLSKFNYTLAIFVWIISIIQVEYMNGFIGSAPFGTVMNTGNLYGNENITKSGGECKTQHDDPAMEVVWRAAYDIHEWNADGCAQMYQSDAHGFRMEQTVANIRPMCYQVYASSFQLVPKKWDNIDANFNFGLFDNIYKLTRGYLNSNSRNAEDQGPQMEHPANYPGGAELYELDTDWKTFWRRESKYNCPAAKNIDFYIQPNDDYTADWISITNWIIMIGTILQLLFHAVIYNVFQTRLNEITMKRRRFGAKFQIFQEAIMIAANRVTLGFLFSQGAFSIFPMMEKFGNVTWSVMGKSVKEVWPSWVWLGGMKCSAFVDLMFANFTYWRIWIAQAKYYAHQPHKLNLDIVKRDAERNGEEPYAPSEPLFSHILKVDDIVDYSAFLTFIVSTAYKCFVIERELGGCRHFMGVCWDIFTSLTNLGLGLASPYSHTETTTHWYSRWSIMSTSALGMFICAEIIQNLANKHKLDPQTTKSMGRLGQRRCDDILKDGAAAVLQVFFKRLTIRKYCKASGLDVKKLDYGKADEMVLTDDEFIIVGTYLDLSDQLDEKLAMWKVMREQIATMYDKFQREVTQAEAEQNILWHYKIIDEMEALSSEITFRTDKIGGALKQIKETMQVTDVESGVPQGRRKSRMHTIRRHSHAEEHARVDHFCENALRRQSMMATHVPGEDDIDEKELLPHSNFNEEQSKVLTDRIIELENAARRDQIEMQNMLNEFEDRMLAKISGMVN